MNDPYLWLVVKSFMRKCSKRFKSAKCIFKISSIFNHSRKKPFKSVYLHWNSTLKLKLSTSSVTLIAFRSRWVGEEALEVLAPVFFGFYCCFFILKFLRKKMTFFEVSLMKKEKKRSQVAALMQSCKFPFQYDGR